MEEQTQSNRQGTEARRSERERERERERQTDRMTEINTCTTVFVDWGG